MENKDRLSDLPDDLIHHIFSFLDARFVAQTCVLSKRWKSLWASSPSIHFAYHSFSDDFRWEKFEGEFSSLKKFVLELLSLKKFVRNFLSCRDKIPLTKVSICADDLERYVSRYDKSEVTELKNSIVKRLIYHSHGLEHLSISSNGLPLIYLCNIESSDPLKTLHLSGLREISSLSTYDLPKLTTLYLNQCSLFSDEFICVNSDPFASLINLKSLILIKFDYTHSNNLKISGRQLESLTIDSMNTSNEVPGLKLEIFAPKLKSFSFKTTEPFEFCNLDAFPFLDIANIDVGIPYIINDVEKFQNFRLNLIDMLRELCHAKSLNISSSTIEVLTS